MRVKRGGKAFARRRRISRTYGTHRSTSFIYWPMPKLHCSWYELMVGCPLSPLMMQVASMPLSLVSPHVPTQEAMGQMLECLSKCFLPLLPQNIFGSLQYIKVTSMGLKICLIYSVCTVYSKELSRQDKWLYLVGPLDFKLFCIHL